MVKRKRKPSKCGECDGLYQLSHEDGIPIFVCDKCGVKDYTWKKFYTEYAILFKDKENWNIDKHKVSCIFGFFCHMYEQKYKTKYVLVPQNPNPYSSRECKEIWKLLSAFNSDANKVRKYMYWVFNKILRNNTDLVSFAYFTVPGLIRKYNLQESRKYTITRSSCLPSGFIDWCRKTVPTIFNQYELSTFNDLGALLQYVNHYNINNSIETVVLTEAERLNLIKNGKLNIEG